MTRVILMQPSILKTNYVNMTIGNTPVEVPNFYERKIYDIPEEFKEDFSVMYYKMPDNKLLEQVSMDLYGSTNYWDFLLVFNGMKSLLDIPVSYDIVLIAIKDTFTKNFENYGSLMIRKKSQNPEKIEQGIVKHFVDKEEDEFISKIVNKHEDISKEDLDYFDFLKRKLDIIIKEKTEENEKFRTIKFLSKNDLQKLKAYWEMSEAEKKRALEQNILL